MLINILPILVCAVVAMVLGFLWYGPLFGKTWMRLTGCTNLDDAQKKEMQKKAGPKYALQFLLAFIQVFVLATFSQGIPPFISVINAIWIWLGFVLPTTAGACLWTNEPRKDAWTRFGIQAGYQLLCFIIFGAILGLW